MDDRQDNFADTGVLCKLIVGIGEVAHITGIPIRQIRYWEEKGIIKSVTEEEGKNRRYDYVNIKKMLLVKLYLEEGYTLEAAVKKLQTRVEFLEDIFRKLQEAEAKRD